MIPRILVGQSLIPISNINAIAHGNSWVANFYASDAAHGFVQLVGAATGLTIRNAGAGSQYITTDPLNPGVRTSGNNMMFTAVTVVDPYLDPAKLNVLFAFECINTAIGNFTAQQIYNAWAAYYTQRKAAAAAVGAKLHICQPLSCPAYIGTDPNETVQSAINALNVTMAATNSLIRANPALVCDSYVELDKIPSFILPNFLPGSFDASGAYSTTPDRVHPNDTGHGLIANHPTYGIVAAQRKWRRKQ